MTYRGVRRLLHFPARFRLHLSFSHFLRKTLTSSDTYYFQGKLGRAQGSHLNHRDVISTLGELCTETISDVETQLAKQKASDEAEVQRLIEEEKQKVEAARLAAEQAEKDRAEKMRKVEEETRNPKANAKNEDDSKPGVDELFVKLGQEFQAIAKTCETIAETINFYA
jgi:sRNA-binding protein